VYIEQNLWSQSKGQEKLNDN